MSQAHPTTTPEQCKTDTFLVFDSVYSNDNLELIGRIEVPRFTRPSEDGVRLTEERQKMLAVARLVESDDTVISNGVGGHIEDPTVLAGHNFRVLSSVDGKMDKVPYEHNPTFDAIWDPEEES